MNLTKNINNSFAQKNTKFKFKTKKHLWFTLIELIIVVIVLAILATIAFVSFNSYSSRGRDSMRLTDINSLNKALELYNIRAAKYPDPTNIYTKVFYSWWTIFEQWSVWKSVYNILSVNINKNPLDPLDGTEYTYSTNTSRGSYQLKANLENKLQSYNPINNWNFVINSFNISNIFENSITTNATATWTTVCYVKWTFNWLIERTNTWDTNYILAVPWLIIWWDADPNLDYGSLSGKVICNWLTNPCIIDYKPTTVYIWEDNTTPTTATEIQEIMVKLQEAYSWSNVASSNSLISNVLNSSWNVLTNLWISMAAKVWITSNNGIIIDNNSCESREYNWYSLDFQDHGVTKSYTKTWATVNWIRTYTISAACNNSTFEFWVENITVACDTWYAQWDWYVCVIHSCTSSIGDSHAHSTASTLNWSAWHYNETPEACSRNCNTWYNWDGSSCKSIYFPWLDWVSGTADDCKWADIKISWQVWSACNLWANTPRNWSNWGNFNPYWSSTRWWNDSVNWYLYQWWRNKWFPSNTTALTTWRLPWTINSNDVYNWVKSSDWINARNDNIWWGSAWNDISRKWPCPTWRHVPSFADWSAAYSNQWWNIRNALKLPYAGDRYRANWKYCDQATNWDYWASNPAWGDIWWAFSFNSSSICVNCWNHSGYAFSVRCIKND